VKKTTTHVQQPGLRTSTMMHNQKIGYTLKTQSESQNTMKTIPIKYSQTAARARKGRSGDSHIHTDRTGAPEEAYTP